MSAFYILALTKYVKSSLSFKILLKYILNNVGFGNIHWYLLSNN